MLRLLLNIEQFIISRSRYNSNKKKINNYKKKIQIFKFENYLCIFCKNKDFKVICDFDKFFIHQKTVYCKKCGLIQSNPRLTDTSLKAYYSNDYYREIYENLKFEKNTFESGAKSKTIFKLASAVIKFNDNEEILEISSHAGYNLIEFKKNNLKVTGIDTSFEAKKIAQKYNILVENKEISEFKNNFKLIMLINVLEHFNDPIKELMEIKKKMNFDSYLFVVLPEINNFSTGMLQQAHCHYYKKNDFIYLLSICGFKLIKFGNYSKNHMYGIFKIENNAISTINYSNIAVTKKILFRRYLKFYKVLGILYNMIFFIKKK